MRWRGIQPRPGCSDGAIGDLALSARGWHRVRRVARTIADLAESDVISAEHVGEALAFRGEG